MDKIVSFIIPSYNVEKYLNICLTSFLNPEVLDQIEVIVVDDGSKDQTAQIARTYIEQYPQVFRLISKENGGHGSAINAGTAQAVGRYLKVIDADDWVVTENLKEFVEKLTDCSADVVLNPYHQVDMQTGEKTVWRMFLDRYETLYTLENVVQNWKNFDRCFAFHGICYNREFYQKHRYELPEKIFYEDHEYTTIPCSYAASIYPMDLYLYQYLVGNAEQSVSVTNRLKRMSHVEKVTEDLPVFLFFHGGGWVTDCIDNYERICARLADATGQYVVAVEYRLAPEDKFPSGLEDCYAVAKALYRGEFVLNVKPENITLIGDSAGGNLCAALSLMARDRGEFMPDRQILIYPATYNDYTENSPFPSVKENGTDYLLTAGKMQDYIDLYARDEEDKKNPYFAPYVAEDVSNQPDTLILTSEFDPLRDEGEEYGKRLKEANNYVEIHRIPDALHGYFALGIRFLHVKESFEIMNCFLNKS